MDINELLSIDAPSPRLEAAELLRQAVKRLERDDPNEDESCIWRIADAGIMIAGLLKDNGSRKIQGLDQPTGRGGMVAAPGEYQPY